MDVSIRVVTNEYEWKRMVTNGLEWTYPYDWIPPKRWIPCEVMKKCKKIKPAIRDEQFSTPKRWGYAARHCQ